MASGAASSSRRPLSRQVTHSTRLSTSRRALGAGAPERVGAYLVCVAVAGYEVDDRDAGGAALAEQAGVGGDHSGGAVRGHGHGGDSHVQMAAVQVYCDDGRLWMVQAQVYWLLRSGKGKTPAWLERAGRTAGRIGCKSGRVNRRLATGLGVGGGTRQPEFRRHSRSALMRETLRRPGGTGAAGAGCCRRDGCGIWSPAVQLLLFSCRSGAGPMTCLPTYAGRL